MMGARSLPPFCCACFATLSCTSSASPDASPDGTDGAVLAVNECTTPGPGWLFCDGFEGGGTAPFWDGTDTGPVLVEDPGAHGIAANHVMRLRVPQGRGGAGVWKSIPGRQKLYARYYVQWEDNHDLTALHHGPGGLAADPARNLGRSGIRPDGTDLIQAMLEFGTGRPHTLYSYTYYPGMYQDCADPNGACWGDSFPCSYDPPGVTNHCTQPADRPTVAQTGVQTGRWYCLEEVVDAGTPTPSADDADGALNFWIDGVEIGPWNGLWMRSAESLQMNVLWLFLYHHDANHSVEGLLLDDVVVAAEPIGCR